MSDANIVVFPRKLLKSFILMYKDLPCLWDKDCISYKVKQKRLDAVTKLTKLVQEYDPSATRVHVLRKIESLRACVRREYKKVVESRRTATCEDDLYTPQLWYYDLFSFIFAEEEANAQPSVKMRPPSRSPTPEQNPSSEHEQDSDAEDDGDDEDEHPFETSMEHNYTEYNSSGDGPENSSKRYGSFDEEKSKRHCTEIEDEYDAIGINVAAKLRSLPPNTRILAEKLINDVLFQAQTNALTTSTIIATQDPFK